MVRYFSVLVLLVLANLSPARDFSGKTFFKSQPVQTSFGCDFFDTAPEEHVVKSDFFKDIKCNVSGVYRCSRQEKKLGAYLGIHEDSNEISIGARVEDYDIFNQKIIYYDPDSGFASPLVRGLFKLRPREVIRGVAFSWRKWLGAFYCDLAFTAAHTEHSWQLEVDDAVIDPVSGLHAISFLQGGVKTSNQNKLLYATIQDVIPSNGYEILGVVITAGSDCSLDRGGVVGIFGEFLAPAASYKYHDELFSPVVGNVGHMGIGIGFRGMVPLITAETFTMGTFSVVKATRFFEKKEKRLTGVAFVTQVGEASENWGHYALAKKTTATVYDPAINLVGPQDLTVRPGEECLLQVGAFFEGKAGVFSASYRGWLRGDEELTLQGQPSSALLYNRVLADGTFGIKPDLESCRVQSVVTHSIMAEASIYLAGGMGNIHVGAGYEFASGNAALDNLSVSAGLSMMF
jgi:hypothetical protein